jgi:putative transposase
VSNYRRAFVPGGCWFFTVNLLDRRRRLLTDHIDALRAATRFTQTRHPLRSTPVLSDHIRAVWALPSGDADFSLRRRLIKIVFERERRNALLGGDTRQWATLTLVTLFPIFME